MVHIGQHHFKAQVLQDMLHLHPYILLESATDTLECRSMLWQERHQTTKST